MDGKYFSELKALINAVNGAVSRLSSKVDLAAAADAATKQGLVDANKQLVVMNAHLAELTQQLSTIGGRFDVLERQIKSLSGQSDEAGQQLTVIEDQIEQIDTQSHV